MNIHNVNWSSKTWSTCSLRFVNMTFWFHGFSVLKASVCVLVFPHIVCINLHRSVSVYRLSIRLYSLLRFFRFTALRVRGVRWISNSVWLRSFHHGPRRCYTEFLRADLCLPCPCIRYGDPPCVSCISHVSMSILTFLPSIRIFYSPSLLSSLPFFSWEMSFAHVYKNLTSIFAIDLLDQNLTSFYIPK